MMDDMARNVDRTVGKSPGIVRLSAIRGPQRAPLHGYAGKQTRSWRPKGSESRGTTGCCIRSKSSWFQAHPFREGNGRTSKVFMAHVAEQSPYRFDFARVSPEQWNAGSAMSRPDMFAYAPEPASLVPVFAAVTVERTAPPAASDRAAQARSALSASYPRPASEATKQTPQQGTQARPPSAGYRATRGPNVGRD